MKQYLVQWEIEICADSPHEAAQKALAIHRDPNSSATCFDVIGDGDEEFTHIDLMEGDDEEE